jgi:hypothetical protein
MVWVSVGVVGGVPWPWGIARLYFFPYSCRLRNVRCLDPSQVTNLLSRAHTCLWEWEDWLLSYRGFWLFSDRLIGDGDRWRSKNHIEGGPQVWELEVQVWMGTWNLWQECNRLVSLVPVVRGVCFSRYPAGHIDSRIAISTWRYDLTTIWRRSKNWHMKDDKMILIAQHLLENRTCTYIECWIMN